MAAYLALLSRNREAILPGRRLGLAESAMVVTHGAHLTTDVVVIGNTFFELFLTYLGQISQFQYLFLGHSLRVFTKISIFSAGLTTNC